MRYLAAMLALGIGIVSWVPAVHAEENGGDACYVSGAIQSCVQPASLTLNTGTDSGMVVGPMTPSHNPFYGGDRN
jgi:hypothetical protein